MSVKSDQNPDSRKKSIRNDEGIPNTHYFLYKKKRYPFNFHLFKYSSKYLSDNESQLSKTENIKLLQDEEEISAAIPDETINDFIKYCHRETISIDDTNVVILNYLSKKYGISTLEKHTEAYIAEHEEELSLIIFSTLFHNKEQNKKIVSKYEDIISSQLLKFINDERLLHLGIVALHRILSKYEINQNEEEMIESFLFKCLDKYGKEASVLFSIFPDMKRSSEIMKKLIVDYCDVFDIAFIPKEIVKNFFLDHSKQFKQQENTITKIQKKLSDLSKQYDDIQKENTKQKELIESQRATINKQKDEIERLKEQIAEIEKLSVINTNEIINFPYKEGNELNGIIKYLSKEGNPHDKKLIEVTTNSLYDSSCHPKNLFDFNAGNCYSAKRGERYFWVCFDFKNMEIEISSYSIKSYSCTGGNIKNWLIEISTDGVNWDKIDSHIDCEDLHHSLVIKTFNANSNHFARYCRLRHIGDFCEYSNSSYPGFRCIEFYGRLKIKK